MDVQSIEEDLVELHEVELHVTLITAGDDVDFMASWPEAAVGHPKVAEQLLLPELDPELGIAHQEVAVVIDDSFFIGLGQLKDLLVGNRHQESILISYDFGSYFPLIESTSNVLVGQLHEHQDALQVVNVLVEVSLVPGIVFV